MRTKITLLNKLKKSDSVTGLDVWYKYFISEVEYKKERVVDVNGTNVSMGDSYTVLIPFDDLFKPYQEWKVLPDKEKFYTISPGDIVLLGIELETEVTPNIIPTIRKIYEPILCEVRSIQEVEQKYGCNYRLKLGGV